MSRRISIIGLGNWGTALAQHLAVSGHDVIAWSVFDDEVCSINDTGKHERLFPDLSLAFKATGDLDEALARDIIVIALPSSVLHHYCDKFSLGSSKILVSVIKGFDRESTRTPLQLIESCVKNPPMLCVLSGPSFAVDVVRGKPCGLVAGSRYAEAADVVAEVFSSDSVRVYTSDDPLGVELGGAVKNVIAVAAGVSDGLGLGESARAGLITRGLAEMSRLAEKMGARRETLTGLSGLGDLIMTASSKTSRNYTVGFRLGQGESLEEILATLGSVAEGVRSTPIVLKLASQHGVVMPITEAMEKLLSGQESAATILRSLIRRPRKAESA